eukprot:TRINITY_DN1176_c0_g1_i7.p1 TRINITY_DN1176_c0_g1~~TRINITY_DN1176_c0_g1_i7.p1  ORF type:complete len:458 (+),score=88.30 TRINITY_DN1176_c0_g1_i7:46-1374(+)
MGGEEPSEAKESKVLAILEEQIDGVYHFRDHYFDTHDISEAVHKAARLKERAQEVLKEMCLRESAGMEEDRAKFLYLKGKLINVEPDYSSQAEEYLSRAVKLNPGLVQAWNELGESYSRKDDFTNARICFEGALQHERNKVSLRSLSMVLRQLGTSTPEEKVVNIEESLVKGKDAVSLDTADGMSWSILGNAFFAHFFLVSQNPKTLKQAMSAYAQADKDPVSRSTPELHYNKGIALKYEEMFENALNSFSTAQRLDPTWDGPKKQEENLLKYLDKISTLIELKGKLKPKKMSSLLESLENKYLGPYSGGSYTSPKGNTATLNHVKFQELSPGLNQERVIMGRVICSVHSEETVPFTFHLIDKDESILVVTLYNLSPGKGVIIGDSVAIAEPFLTNIDFTYKQRHYKFGLIRVESPLVLVINGKKAGKDLQAGVQMTTFPKS